MASFHFNTRSATSPAPQAVSTTFKTQVEMLSANNGRGQLFELNVGPDGVPNVTDCSIVYDVSRATATCTGVTAIINAMNPADSSASRTTGKINATAEGTVTANSMIWSVVLNQRASQRWIAAPGFELVWPIGSGTGLVSRALSTNYTNSAGVSVYFTDL